MTDTKEDPLLFRKTDEEYWENIDVNDCGFLLRTLEREAYTAVVNALRAKGPPSEHTFLLLDHLKSALSINDEVGRAEIRRAASDSKLSKISSILNPSYDTITEWSTCSIEPRGGVEARPSRGKPFARTTTTSIADQLLEQATCCNEKMNQSLGRSVELLSIPHKPFVPERLRVLLAETDRPCERVPPPLEKPPPPPVHVPDPIEPPVKKRRHRASKASKERANPPNIRTEKSPKAEEDKSMDASSLNATTPVTPIQPLACGPTAGSGGSTILSTNQPPQSGDAMKNWVSKIHEKEVAASARKNGGIGVIGTGTGTGAGTGVAPLDVPGPSTSTSTPVTPADEETGKKKRRSRTATIDPYLLNTCARTRPFNWKEREEDKTPGGKQKPTQAESQERSGDKRSSSKRSSPGVFTAPVTTPVARPPHPDPFLSYLPQQGIRNGSIDESATLLAMASVASAATAVAFGGVNPTTPTTSQVKKPIVANSIRAPLKYVVPNSATVAGSSHSIVKTPIGGGLTGRTSSLGNQQMNSINHPVQKATPSTSNSSIHSIGTRPGGSMVTPSAAAADPAQPVSALPPEAGGHDYSFTGMHSDTLGGQRFIPRIMPRIPQPSILRNQSAMSSPQHGQHGPHPHSSSFSPYYGVHSSVLSTDSIPQRATPSRPRSGSRGTTSGTSAGGSGSVDRTVNSVRTDPVTDGLVQATVQTILLETAQKECANGKRWSVLPRENGLINHQSTPTPIPSVGTLNPTTPSYAVCQPSTSSGAHGGSAPSSNLTRPSVARPMVNKPTPPSVAPSVIPPPPPLPLPLPLPTPISNIASSSLVNLVPSSSSSFVSNVSTTPSIASVPSAPSLNFVPPYPQVNQLRDYLMLAKENPLLGDSMLSNVRLQDPSVQVPPNPSPIPSSSSPLPSTRPPQRQYVLQPQGMGYSEFSLDNPTSYKSFASDGTPVQWGVTAEELQGGIGRPSISGMNSGGNIGMRRTTQSPQIIPSTSRQIVPSTVSFSTGTVNELSSLSGVSQVARAAAGADTIPPDNQPPSSDVKDILEQSCMELR